MIDIVAVDTTDMLNVHKSIIVNMANEFDKSIIKYIPQILVKYASGNSALLFIDWMKKSVIGNKDNQYFLFMDQDTIVGYVLLMYDETRKIMNISSIFVYEKYRGKGYAKYAIMEIRDKCATLRNVNALTLSVFSINPASKLYEKLGFKTYAQDMYLPT